MIKKIKFSWDIVKAYNLDALGKYNEALKILNKYHNFIQKHKYIFPEYFALKGSIYFRLSHFSQAQEVLENGLIYLKESKLSLDEQKYLAKYIYTILIDMAKETKHKLVLNKYQELSKNISYDISKIRKSFLRNFPVA